MSDREAWDRAVRWAEERFAHAMITARTLDGTILRVRGSGRLLGRPRHEVEGADMRTLYASDYGDTQEYLTTLTSRGRYDEWATATLLTADGAPLRVAGRGWWTDPDRVIVVTVPLSEIAD